MSSTLAELTEKVSRVSDIHAVRAGIERDADWYVLKLSEELGELAAEYLRTTARGRKGDEPAAEGIDVESVLERKWFKYLR